MLISATRQLRKTRLFYSVIRNMSSGVSYAAAVSTPNGTMRQPQIQARACSDPDLRASFEEQTKEKKSGAKALRPGAGVRSTTSFRGWGALKKTENQSERGAVQHAQHDFGPRTEHTPNTDAHEEHVYVLTLKLEESLSTPMNSLREQYFPKRINKTPAHLTLFHALPHSHITKLQQGLSELSRNTRPFQVTTGGPFRMRKGVGVNVDAGYQKMKSLHSQLRSQWLTFLSEQDQGGFKPHWTVMNKVDDEKEVGHALSAVRQTLSQSTKEGQAIGLMLWRYDRGHWIWAEEYVFGAMKKTDPKPASKNNASSEQAPGSEVNKSSGVLKQGSNVADAWRSMSFRR
jgi:mannose-1-phosphate guanylyltransferase